ncbi:phosphocarrier protein HPr /dihydroxyacetone kinase DhaM subunit [Isoptericola sp. CG 20/1183]|uniref:Phosphocarrier protein HPr n=1 Tax=Isoptericola halotolerans TaxID=300560 RepID=A0ABX5ECX2_9MICO|nr:MULTISPECIES: dihydroxyacetone kinase phosphoryl donor subunit DhaM [Isoptericola]PRZ05690.1 phosphocarrier protein HPr /dihydroxyacetone kinase DhaM subunit [Isoptericola halotolerans]PRZ06258.1 phosphocarrier protein HPr /dihydroxyacetone kinase DhaM subunit [Isoptericola sp. CG 20/1183]
MSVGLVLVAHSAMLADGTAELARQMAPDVELRCAAGDLDGGLGTSLPRVQDALSAALAAVDGVVVLADLGSAVLTVESALELDPELPPRVRLVSAPFVEGAVAAAVTAQQGAGLDAVAEAAESAVLSIGPEPVLQLVQAPGSGTADSPAVVGTRASGEAIPVPDPTSSGDADQVSVTVEVRNPLGLHARPAAVVARSVADLGVPVTINGADATSVLQLMSLGTSAGDVVTIAARGPDAEAAAAVVAGLVQGGFGEL